MFVEYADEAGNVEEVVEVPLADAGTYLYVCTQCGYPLTDIPYYNRYYCENCGLHY